MKNLHKKKKSNYQARIRFDPSEPIIYKSLGTQNHAIALKRLDDLYTRLELEREGMVTPERIKTARNDSIAHHLRNYLTDLETTATSEDYTTRVYQRLQKLSKECGWSLLKHVDSMAFINWRSRQKLTPKTLNDYLSMLNCFMSWLLDNGFLGENPIAKVKRIPVRGRHAFERRALSGQEIKKLLSAAPESRRVVYVVALTTGLRRGELEAVKVADIFLDADQPYLRARASTTKNGKEALLYLHADAVDILRGWLFGLDRDSLCFDVPSMDIFRKDLKFAGIDSSNSGSRLDFHSLRHTFCTRLAQSGISPQVAKEAMRHSDIALTTNIYTDAGQLSVASDLLRLPSLYGGGHRVPQTTPKNVFPSKHSIIFELVQALGLQGDSLVNLGKKMVEAGGIKPLADGRPAAWCRIWRGNRARNGKRCGSRRAARS